nr:helix-turn-helix transcriptional regulator [Pedobacter sp. ASV2]
MEYRRSYALDTVNNSRMSENVPLKDNFLYSKSRLSDTLLEKFVTTLEKEMNEKELFKDPDITLESLAKSIRITPAHLTQVLSMKIGCNFYTYINSLRATYALSLINQGNYKIYDVYMQSGFSNRVSFNRYFKKVQGYTPSEYIKAINNQTVPQN